MSMKKFSAAMSELDSKYVDEAVNYKKRTPKVIWSMCGTISACLCLIIAGGIIMIQNGMQSEPNPEMIQIANPIITVETIEEIEKYLDFTVPVLEKEVESYSVIVMDTYPTIGQVYYEDGSKFRVQYGSGDISGISGGTLVENKEIDGVKVECFRLTNKDYDITYAIWEQKGFTFSYTYVDDNEAELETLIQHYK